MDTPITRAEHEEFRRRFEEWEHRQDKRLELLEENTERVSSLSVSIEKLAVNMENMCSELTRQGKRLEEVEGRDGEMWRKVVLCVITAALGAAVGFLCTRLGIG